MDFSDYSLFLYSNSSQPYLTPRILKPGGEESNWNSTSVQEGHHHVLYQYGILRYHLKDLVAQELYVSKLSNPKLLVACY